MNRGRGRGDRGRGGPTTNDRGRGRGQSSGQVRTDNRGGQPAGGAERYQRDQGYRPPASRGSEVSRGGRGGCGGLPKALANYFEVSMPQDLVFYQYGLDFGGVDSRSLRKRLWGHFVRELARQTGAEEDFENILFDGTSAFSIRPLPIQRCNTLTLVINEHDYEVSIASENEISFKKKDKNIDQICNIILKKAMEHALQRIGRHFYEADNQLELPEEMSALIRVLPGFQTEIANKRFGGNKVRMVVNIDTMSKVISQMNVLQIMQSVCPRGAPTAEQKQELRRRLVGTIVFTTYNNQPYTVEQIEFSMNPMSSFPLFNRKSNTNTEISYWDYYNVIKNWKIYDKEQPLLRTSGRNNRKIYLLPETCLISDIFSDMKAKEALPRLCSITPTDRKRRIESLPLLLNRNDKSKQVLDAFKMKVSSQAVEVQATLVKPPVLYMPGVGSFEPTKTWGGESGTKLKFTSSTRPIMVTAYITFENINKRMAEEYAETIQEDMKQKNAPRQLNIELVNIGNNPDHIRGLKAKVPSPAKPCMIISFLSDADNKASYGKIKEFCNRQGYISQCINVSKQRAKAKNKSTIIGNIMKQILNKYGNLCWWVEVPKCCPSLKGKTVMLIGIDVYHAKKRFIEKTNVYTQRRSIGAFVSVIIDHTGAYKTSCEIVEVEARKELLCRADSDSDNSSVHSEGDKSYAAAETILEAPEITRSNTLENFVTRSIKEHNVKPDLVVVYRDGVGDSQLDAVKATEVIQVKNAAKQSKYVYMVVQKRIHSRFIIETQDGQVGNPPPGTVVDKDCGSENHPDFYLIPTRSNNSTVKPVHYILLHNDNAVPMKELQQLTFAMCHCYPNWTDSIKLPFPTQLAHKLAYQMGESQIAKPEISPALHTTYFYL